MSGRSPSSSRHRSPPRWTSQKDGELEAVFDRIAKEWAGSTSSFTPSRSRGKRLVDIAEVGRVVTFLVGGASSGMAGDTIYVDGGLHNMA